MSALPLLIEFSDKRIKVRVDGPELALTAPKGALTPCLVFKIKEEKAALMVSLERIREISGEDFEEVVNDPVKLKTFADLIAIKDMRHRGIAPDHYTATTECRHCGPVPIWQGCPAEVLGCPWCLNRHAGLPMPEVKLRQETHDD